MLTAASCSTNGLYTVNWVLCCIYIYAAWFVYKDVNRYICIYAEHIYIYWALQIYIHIYILYIYFYMFNWLFVYLRDGNICK